jgi:hypothetical protein
MESRPKGKILFLALAVCIAFSVVFAETLIANDLDHDCTGEGCPFCLTIETANNFLKSLKLGALAVFLAACPVFAVLNFRRYTEVISCTFSPVALKVRFNS